MYVWSVRTAEYLVHWTKDKRLENWKTFHENAIQIQVARLSATVQVCITPLDQSPTAASLWFTARIDPGFTGNLLLDDLQFRVYSQNQRHSFPLHGWTTFHSVGSAFPNVPRRDGTLWLRCDDQSPDIKKINVIGGFECLPPPTCIDVPLLGCAAFEAADLTISLDYANEVFSLEQLKIGQRAIKRLWAKQQEIEDAIQVQTTRRAGSPSGSSNSLLGEILVELGVLSPEQLRGLET